MLQLLQPPVVVDDLGKVLAGEAAKRLGEDSQKAYSIPQFSLVQSKAPPITQRGGAGTTG